MIGTQYLPIIKDWILKFYAFPRRRENKEKAKKDKKKREKKVKKEGLLLFGESVINKTKLIEILSKEMNFKIIKIDSDTKKTSQTLTKLLYEATQSRTLAFPLPSKNLQIEV